MPSKSKSKCQKTGECASPDAKDFAKTKHKDLPNKMKKKKGGKFSDWMKKKEEVNEVTMGQTGYQGSDRVNIGKMAAELSYAIKNATGLSSWERVQNGGLMPFEKEALAKLRDLIDEVVKAYYNSCPRPSLCYKKPPIKSDSL